MDKIVVSAPGKLLLMGEHSVVYDHPCLVAAVSKRVKIQIEKSENDQWQDGKFSSAAIKAFRDQFKNNQTLKITVTTEFNSNYGLGSSSAITVGIAYGLYQMFRDSSPSVDLGLGMTGEGGKQLFNFCYNVVKNVQGVASGFDIAAAIYGGILYFETGGKIIESVPVVDLPLLVAYSGNKADTVSMINLVKEKMATHQKGAEEIFSNISNLVNEGKTALLEKDWQRLGTLFNFNQDYLEDLGVSTEKLDDMTNSARKAGAYGAKLSGAGGGDCMIAIIPEEKRQEISSAIEKVGGEVLDVKVSNKGVRIENF